MTLTVKVIKNKSATLDLNKGVRKVVSDAKIFEKYGIKLYLLAGTNSNNLGEYASRNELVQDIISGAVNYIIGAAYWLQTLGCDYQEWDGLVLKTSAFAHSEASEKYSVYLNHGEVCLDDNEAYNKCVEWLSE